MTDYPYSRSGEPVCYYKGEVSERELRESAEVGDNQVVFDDDRVYLYEAPAEDDPGRGHFTVWNKKDDGRFKQGDAISGDDGMCYKKFSQRAR
jgi:hypothetical protein